MRSFLTPVSILTFLENKLRKKNVFWKLWAFFQRISLVHFESLIEWDCGCVCHDWRNKQEGIYVKKRAYERRNWHKSDLYSSNLPSNKYFLAKYDHIFSCYCVLFEPLLQWYARTMELKKKEFKANRENMKQTTGIQVNFILIIELQKYMF